MPSVDYRLMHRKVDQIASFLGIVLYYPVMEQITLGGSGQRASGRNAGAPPMEHNVEAVLQPSRRSLSGGLTQDISFLPYELMLNFLFESC